MLLAAAIPGGSTALRCRGRAVRSGCRATFVQVKCQNALVLAYRRSLTNRSWSKLALSFPRLRASITTYYSLVTRI